jgi:hypothetical protein
MISGNGVTSEVDALMYVVLSKAEKQEPYGEIVGTTECKCYIHGVAQTDVVTTEFNYICK